MLFSLGGALFGLPPADGHIVPDEGVPEAWLLLFVEGHADSGVYAGVFSASKAGQGWALSTAPKGRLRYDTTVAQPANVWIARLAKDAVMLAIRGALPTHLCVTCDGSPESEAACQVVTDMLSGYGSGVTCLRTCDQGLNGPTAAYIGFMQRAPQCSPTSHRWTCAPVYHLSHHPAHGHS